MCILSGDPYLQRLDYLQDVAPPEARRGIAEGIARLEKTGRTADPRYPMLLALATEAAENPSTQDARSALAKLRRLDIKSSSLRLQVMLHAAQYREDQTDRLRDLTNGYKPVSREKACGLAVIGLNEINRNDIDAATRASITAYRVAQMLHLPDEAALAATNLATIMYRSGDYGSIFPLLDEMIGWARDSGRTARLADYLYYKGKTYSALRNHAAALIYFDQSLALARKLHSAHHVQIDLLGICKEEVDAGAPPAALRACRLASAGAESLHDQKIAASLLAQVYAARKQDGQALALLNKALAPAPEVDAAIPQYIAPSLELRSRLHAGRGQYREALDDLAAYTVLYKKMNDAERNRQSQMLRAKFETDQQIEKNGVLAREVRLGQARDHARLRAILAIGGSAIVVVALMAYVVLYTRRHERQVLRLAQTDPLTGLSNRRHLTEQAEALTASGRRLCVALLDLDHFKHVNDTFGHDAGDRVLARFADAVRSTLRQQDRVGRWGGEEFLLLLPQSTPDEAAAVVDRLRAEAARVAFTFDDAYRLRFSAGVAQAGVDGVEDAVRRADLALYQAKHAGRNQTCRDGGSDPRPRIA